MTTLNPQFTFADLFAGIGGFRLALEGAGGRCVFSSEWDKYSQQTYFANFQELPAGDITQIPEESIPDFDLLTAGFPCQPFSTIGKREGFEHPTQGTLFYDVVRIVKHKQPKAFILENVEGLVSHDGGRTLSTIINTLACSVNGQYLLADPENLGYHIFWKVLDAANYGVPQFRKRIFIVGISSSEYPHIPAFEFPKPHKEKAYIGKYVETHLEGYEISEHLQKTYIYKLDDGRPEIIDPSSRVQVKTLVATYHKIQRLTGTFVRDGKTGLRLLSENECKAIMGFDPNFKIPVSRTQMYRQFGNSIAVPVARAVAKNLVACLGMNQMLLSQNQNVPEVQNA